jgi:hypothetical protein
MNEELEACDILDFSTFNQRDAALDPIQHQRLNVAASLLIMDVANDHNTCLQISGLFLRPAPTYKYMSKRLRK